jgi:hypothetical protein
MSLLTELGIKYNTDKVGHGFLPHYEKYTQSMRNNDVNILELGVLYGASIKMWHEYFPNGSIYAVDWWQGLNGNKDTFENPCKFLEEAKLLDRITTLNLNQHDINDLNKFVNDYNLVQFDWILDDGSHLSQDQQQTLGYLWHLVKPGGYYIIEDIHCSLQGYDNLPDLSNSTLTMLYHYKQNKMIKSDYITEKQKQCLDSEIDFIDIVITNGINEYQFSSGTAILKKK